MLYSTASWNQHWLDYIYAFIVDFIIKRNKLFAEISTILYIKNNNKIASVDQIRVHFVIKLNNNRLIVERKQLLLRLSYNHEKIK